MTQSFIGCGHSSFRVEANVDRTVAQNGDTLSLRLAVQAHCERCGAKLWFPTHATGDSHAVATTDTTGYVLTVPMALAGQPFKPDRRLPSSILRNTDLTKGQ